MKSFLQTLFFFFLVTQICSAQWYQQNSGTLQNFNAVTFIDENNGWAVGDSGTIIYTSNSGETWTLQSSGTNLNLLDVQFTNINDGWAVGGNDDLSTGDSLAVILHTTNKGTSWINQAISNIHKCFYDCNFINDDTGVIVGITSDSTGIHGVILQTTDKGLNWAQQIRGMGEGCFRMSVHFNDANIGWQTETWGSTFYSTYIHRTTDGGSNWYQQYITNSTAELNRIKFFNINFGISVGSTIYSPKLDNTENIERPFVGIITRTIDGGTSWDEQIEGIPELKDVDMVSTNFIIAVGVGTDTTTPIPNNYGAILVSNDTGMSWYVQSSGVNNSLNGVSFIDSLIGWIVGDHGTILHTTNGGVTFVEEEEIDEMPTEFFLSNNFPNPFNPSTTFGYSIPNVSKVVIKVFDILGEEIETLVNEEKPIGTYEITWYAEGLPSGVYFYQLKAGDFIQTKKMLLLK